MKLSDHVKTGERWFVRLPGGYTLSHMAVVDTTDQTVAFKSVDIPFYSETRFKKIDVEFVEKSGPFKPDD